MSSVLPTPDEPAEPLDPAEPAGAAPEPKPEPRWGLGDVASTLGLTILIGTFAVAVADAVAPAGRPGAGRAWASVLLLVVPWLALGGWPLLASFRKGNGPVRDYGLRLTWPQAGLGFLGGVAAIALGSIVAEVQQAITGVHLSAAVTDLAKSSTAASAAALAVLAACTAFGAPVVEELAFRGLTYGAVLKRGVPVAYSVAATTVVFALFHFEPERILVLLVIGACLGVVRAWTGSTAASMITHMTVNIPGALYILGLAHH
jgi:uncharacterized protein